VSQISPPIRILLVCALAFMGAYMLFLRPKDAVVPPADPAPNIQTGAPAESGAGKAVEAAQGAVAAADGQLAQQESVDGVDAGESAAGTQSATKTSKSGGAQAAAPAGKVDVAGLPKPVAKAIRKGQVLVLLFWNGKSADDVAVHQALAKVDRWDGRVSVQSASIKKISQYGRIARGVDIEQSPTVVVADPKLRADTLVGYVDTQTIDQAVVDAFRNSGGLFTDAYLRKVDAVCVDHSNKIAALPGYYTRGNVAKQNTRLDVYDRAVQNLMLDFGAVKAPKKWAAFKAAAAKDMATFELSLSQYATKVTPKSSFASVAAADQAFRKATKPTADRLNHRFDNQGLFRCGSAL
jgi:hypothetical protein